MKKISKKLLILASIAAQVWVSTATAAIPRTNIYFDIRTVIQPMESLRDIKSSDVAKIIPSDMTDTDSSGQVATRILDYSLNNFFKSPEMRNSDFGRSAQRVEQVMEQDVSFGGDEVGATKHTVKFKMKPVQTRAQLDYSGFINAQLSYQVSNAQLALEVIEHMTTSTDFVVSHTNLPSEQRQMVSLRFKF